MWLCTYNLCSYVYEALTQLIKLFAQLAQLKQLIKLMRKWKR